VPGAAIFLVALPFTGAFDVLLAMGEEVGEHVNLSKEKRKSKRTLIDKSRQKCSQVKKRK
jgi:hypothetical protein